MNRFAMNGLTMIGMVMAVAGLIAFAIPVFMTQQTKEVAHIGDLKLQTTESRAYVIPPVLAGGGLLLGLVFIGAGFFQKR